METRRRRSSQPTVVVGVGAGIAAYKVAHVVRDFRRLGWTVYVVPTPASLEFVGAATWRELSENPVQTDVFNNGEQGHVDLARTADLIVLAPATADLLARARAGMAGDLLTTTLLASAAPVVAFPAMHTQMWLNSATQDNVSVLRERGWTVVDPDEGPLSSGDTGPGRLPEPEVIVARAVEVITARQSPRPLAGRQVLITAGGTREAIDPVRFIGNRSSGTQGVALAREARRREAEVTLVAAAVETALPSQGEEIEVVRVTSAAQMFESVSQLAPHCDALIMCAAVGDFRPVQKSSTKIKKSQDSDILTLELRENPDILATLSSSADRPEVLVGFGAETGDKMTVKRLGREKALRKGADLLAVNAVGERSGFGDVDSELFYFDSSGKEIGSVKGTKTELASSLMDHVEALFDERSSN